MTENAVKVPQTPHLKDLFDIGKSLTVKPGAGKPDIDVWIQKPSSPQQEMAHKEARIKRSRRKAELLAEDSDERVVLEMDLADYDYDRLAKEILSVKRSEHERRAMAEVLYKKDVGSDWGDEGEKYFDVLYASIQRSQEILEQHSEDPQASRAALYEDVEYQRLAEIEKRFQDEVQEHLQEILDLEAAQLKAGKSIEELRKELIKLWVETETEVTWFQHYQTLMIYYSVRWPDDHTRLYFEKVEDYTSLPPTVQQQIADAYNNLGVGVEQAKNSDTPLPS